MKDSFVAIGGGLIIALVVVLTVVAVSLAVSRSQKDCEAAGGVSVRGLWGYECVQRIEVKP